MRAVIDDGADDYRIVKAGGSSLALTGSSTWTGGISVNGGNLYFANEGNLGGANADVLLNGGYLYFTGSGNTTIDLSVGSGVTAGLDLASDKLYLGTNLTFTGTSTLYVRGSILRAAAGAKIHINGSTTFYNNRQHTSSGVSVPIVLNSNDLTVTVGSFGSSRAIRVYGSISGTGNLTGLGVHAGWPTGPYGANTFVGTYTSYGQTHVSGSNQGLTNVVVRYGDSHRKRLELEASNALAPASSTNPPVLRWTGGHSTFDMNGRAQTLGGLSSTLGDVANMGALTLNVGEGESYTFTRPISGAGKLTKKGLGTQILSGTCSHSAGTDVQAGTLDVRATLSGIGAVTVSGRLAGTGTISGPVTVNSGGVLEPGPAGAVGTHTLAAGLTLSDGAILDLQAGATTDLVRVTGGTFTGVDPGQRVFVRLSDSGEMVRGQPYVLIDWTEASASGVDASDFRCTADSPVNGTFGIQGTQLTVTPLFPGGVLLVR